MLLQKALIQADVTYSEKMVLLINMNGGTQTKTAAKLKSNLAADGNISYIVVSGVKV